ncbi:hypothetical protein AAES_17569 [Amazona aestiva]|uniref:Uncharacterized protein n=1 Tax=Amazona aestiva TaxID=12930 RepID=A0A0Q3X9W5_AMAAE|nr:hypothetical protein AAES_17569 [Amazona aestiva]
MDVDFYVAFRLLFTVLALVLAPVFVRLWGAEEGRPWETPAAESTQNCSPRDLETMREVAEEVSPVAEPTPCGSRATGGDGYQAARGDCGEDGH